MKKTVLILISMLFFSRAVDMSHAPSFLSTDLSTDSITEADAGQATLYAAVANLYNVFIADPMSAQDPGFQTFEVFKLNWDSGATSDARFRIPKEFYVRDLLDCSADVSSDTVTGMTSYKKSLSQTVSISAEYDGLIAKASFQGSVGYQKASEGMQRSETVSTIRKRSCRTYIVALNDNAEKEINPVLARVMKRYHDRNDWEGFITKYGAYYVWKAVYGAMAYEKNTVSKTDAEKLAQNGLDISASISGSYGLFKGSVKSDTKTSNEQKNVQSSVKVTSSTWIVGVAPDKDRPDDFNAWVDKVQNSKLTAQPVNYFINSLEDVFDILYWPESLNIVKTQEDLDKYKVGFVTALKKIAGRYPSVPLDITLNTTRIVAAVAPTQIDFGQNFNVGQTRDWKSQNGKYMFSWTSEGDLVIYYVSTVIWSTKTRTKARGFRLNSGNGNMEIVGEGDVVIWSAGNGAVGDGSSNYLRLQDDGNLVLYDRNDQVRWASGTNGKTSPMPPSGDTIYFPRDVYAPETWTSRDGRVTLNWQGDGNLVVYCKGRATWSPRTDGKGYKLAFQNDGNFVVYGRPDKNKNMKAHWSPRTENRNGSGVGFRLTIQNDGNLVLYEPSGRARWSTKTKCK